MLYQHSALEPLGVWETIREDARGLYVKGRLVLDVVRAREVKALLREGVELGGYDVTLAKPQDIGYDWSRIPPEPKEGLRASLRRRS